MAVSFPTSLDTLTNPSSTNPQNSPSHSQQHSDANDAIEALEAKVGVDSSAVTSSHDYKIRQLESGKFNIVTKTTNYTAASTDCIILANGTITITLPTAVGVSGKCYIVKRINATGDVTIDTTSSQTIDGFPDWLLPTRNDVLWVVSDGSNWHRLT